MRRSYWRRRQGWGKAGQGWGGVEPPGEQGGADRDGAVGTRNARRLGLTQSMA